MTNAGWTTIAALGSSALTGLVSWWVSYRHDQRLAKKRSQDDLRQAVTDVLSVSLTLSLRAKHLAVMSQHYGERGTRLDILFGLETRADLTVLFEPLLLTHDQIGRAVSKVWLSGDATLISAANNVQLQATDVLTEMTDTDEITRSSSDGTVADSPRHDAIHRLGEARQALAHLARERFAESRVDFGADSAGTRMLLGG